MLLPLRKYANYLNIIIWFPPLYPTVSNTQFRLSNNIFCDTVRYTQLLQYSIVTVKYCYSTVLLQDSIVTVQYCYSTVLLQYSIVTLLYCYSTVLLEYSIVTLLYCYSTVLCFKSCSAGDTKSTTLFLWSNNGADYVLPDDTGIH